MTNREQLRLGAEELGLQLDDETIDKLITYLELLIRWNKVYNLTAIKNPEEMVSVHLLDSMAASSYLWPGKWLDVGCGPGLPGIILAALHPGWEFTLIDSNSKKTSFVKQAVITLQLQNVSVVNGRVEDLEGTQLFDGITSRAFASLSEFIVMTRHLIAEGGRWAAYKGDPKQELEQLPQDCEIERVIRLKVPGVNAARSLVIASCRGSHD